MHAAVVYYQPPERIRLHSLNPATQDYNIDLDGDGNYDLQHDSVGLSTFLRSWGETRFLGLKQPYQFVTWYDSLPFPLVAGMSIGPDSPSLFPQLAPCPVGSGSRRALRAWHPCMCATMQEHRDSSWAPGVLSASNS
jgi:hypothetical protein